MKRSLKGSYTIEASVITALVFFMTIIIICSAFLAYDKVSASFTMKETLLWGKNQILTGFEIDADALAEKAKDLQGYFIITDGVHYEGKVSGDSFTMICKAQSSIFPMAAKIYNLWEPIQEWSIETKTVIRKPEHALRMLRILKEEK